VPAPPEPTSLPGSPDERAASRTFEYDADATFPLNEFEVDPIGATVLRSRVIFGFRPDSTVEKVNSLLASLRASIVLSGANGTTLEVRIPDPGSLPALEAIIDGMMTNPIVTFALPSTSPPPNAIPQAFYSGPPPSLSRIANHLSVKAAAAWNARRAVSLATTERPVLSIVDYFGAGTGNLATGLLQGNLIGAPYHHSDPKRHVAHGYHVLGIAAAAFADGNFITGMYGGTEPFDILALDLVQKPGKYEHEAVLICRALARLTSAGRNVVLNTSFGWNQPRTTGKPDTYIEAERQLWLQRMRGDCPGARSRINESRWFNASSAGNNPALKARNNTGRDRAAIDGQLSNTAVIENRVGTTSSPFSGGCLAAGDFGSSREGILSAIGTSVWSFVDPTGGVDVKSGTSMAAPQVAGLASFLWSVRPNFGSSQLLQVILAHAAKTPCADGTPLIDAYQTILAADDTPVSGDPTQPYRPLVRLAVLDVNEDGLFDYLDARSFVDAFVDHETDQDALKDPVKTVAIGTKTVDLSRFDLNGNGKVGGTGVGRFNLDIDYGSRRDSQYNLALTYPDSSLLLSGRDELLITVNERELTDLQILCYYTRSELMDLTGSFGGWGEYAFQGHLAMRTGFGCDGRPPVLRTTAITCTPTTVTMTGVASGATMGLFPAQNIVQGTTAIARRITASCGAWLVVEDPSVRVGQFCRRLPTQPDSTEWSFTFSEPDSGRFDAPPFAPFNVLSSNAETGRSVYTYVTCPQAGLPQ
jgi:hypothetical protein